MPSAPRRESRRPSSTRPRPARLARALRARPRGRTPPPTSRETKIGDVKIQPSVRQLPVVRQPTAVMPMLLRERQSEHAESRRPCRCTGESPARPAARASRLKPGWRDDALSGQQSTGVMSAAIMPQGRPGPPFSAEAIEGARRCYLVNDMRKVSNLLLPLALVATRAEAAGLRWPLPTLRRRGNSEVLCRASTSGTRIVGIVFLVNVDSSCVTTTRPSAGCSCQQLRHRPPPRALVRPNRFFHRSRTCDDSRARERYRRSGSRLSRAVFHRTSRWIEAKAGRAFRRKDFVVRLPADRRRRRAAALDDAGGSACRA